MFQVWFLKMSSLLRKIPSGSSNQLYLYWNQAYCVIHELNPALIVLNRCVWIFFDYHLFFSVTFALKYKKDFKSVFKGDKKNFWGPPSKLNNRNIIMWSNKWPKINKQIHIHYTGLWHDFTAFNTLVDTQWSLFYFKNHFWILHTMNL